MSGCGESCACGALRIWPELPALQPPPLPAVWSGKDPDWTLVHPYLGPLIDGTATLMLPGMRTDGGSIPQAAWSVIGHPFQLPCLAYFLPHDADYAAELRPRLECDRRLLEGMRLDGHVDADKRLAIYKSVRNFGWRPWNRHTQETIREARRFCRIVGNEEYIAMVEAKTWKI